MSNRNLPIGVFDSGIGGVTVLKSLVETFPNENFIYLGDTARLPYGSKSPSTISNYSKQNIEFLYKRGVKAIIIACSSASSHCNIDLFKGIPIYNVITPSAQLAVESTKSGHIGILGTRATVSSSSYPKAIEKLNPNLKVFQQACPLFVPLAEEGLSDDEVTRIVAQRYLQSLKNNNVDTIILGCTHYPIILPTLKKLTFDRAILWVDSGYSVAKILKSEFSMSRILKNDDENANKRTIEVVTTDSSDQFIQLAIKILEPIAINQFSVGNIV